MSACRFEIGNLAEAWQVYVDMLVDLARAVCGSRCLRSSTEVAAGARYLR